MLKRTKTHALWEISPTTFPTLRLYVGADLPRPESDEHALRSQYYLKRAQRKSTNLQSCFI